MERDSSSAQPYRLTENLAETLSLTQGQVLRARVVSRLGEGQDKLVLELKGKRVIARSELEVDEDQTLLVRVESLKHPIELKLFELSEARSELTEGELRGYLETRNLESSDESVEFLKNWLDEDLPLDDSHLEKALENRYLLSGGSSEKFQPDRMWSFCFLEERGVNPTEETVDLLSRVREVNGDGNWTRFVSDNAGGVSVEEGKINVRESVEFIGFDLINRLGKRPHEASRTLHAMLLKALKGNVSDVTASTSILKGLLGQILGVALVNLERTNEFLFFVPVLQEGTVDLVWVGGRLKSEGEPGWRMNAFLPLNHLGDLEVVAEKSPGRCRVKLTSDRSEVVELLRDRTRELTSQFDDKTWSMTVTVNKDRPRKDFDFFSLRNTSSGDVKSSFSQGLDLTV